MQKRSTGAVRGRVRQRLLRFVARQGAIHKARVARDLGVGWSTVQHHARVLVRERKLREIEYRGLLFLVPADVPPSRVARAVVLGLPEHREALRVIVRHRERRIQDVARSLGWSRKTARRCMYALLAVGLVEKSGDYHPRFGPTVAGHAAVRRSR